MRISDWSSDVCSSDLRIKAAGEAALAQMADVDAVLRTAEEVREAIRAARLALEKAVKAEKENRKASIVSDARMAVKDHHAALNASLEENGSAACRERVCQYVTS